jgi:hypothetical protein
VEVLVGDQVFLSTQASGSIDSGCVTYSSTIDARAILRPDSGLRKETAAKVDRTRTTGPRHLAKLARASRRK